MSWSMLGPAALHPDPNKIHGGLPVVTPEDVRHALGGLATRPFLFGMAAFLAHRASLDEIQVLLTHDLSDLALRRRWGAGRDARGRGTGELTSEDIITLDRMARLMLFEVISAQSRHDTYAHEESLPTGSATVLCPQCRGRGDVARAATEQEVRDLEQACRDALGYTMEAVRRGIPRARVQFLTEARQDLALAKTRPVSEECDLCGGRGRFLLTESRRAQMLGVSRPTWYQRWEARYAEAINIPQRWEAIAISHVRKKLHGDG